MEEKVYARIRQGNQMVQIRTTPFRLMTESGVQVPVVMECMHSRPATGREMNRVQSLSSRRNTVGQGRDSLTGFLNKRGFCGELYGEGKANRVLMILAGRIREGLSEHSYAARIYGDEFAIFCRAGAYEEKNLKKTAERYFPGRGKGYLSHSGTCWRVCSDGPGYSGSYYD